MLAGSDSVRSATTTTPGALAGVRVLDLSRVLAAPLATQCLGDMGAQVIKVERPGKGDESREYGPPFVKDLDGQPTTDAAFYLSCNRNKQSVTVDLASPDGQQIIRQLAAQSDVVIENFKAGALARYGLDYASLKAVNPELIYCSITGFGQTGPLSHKPGYDGVFQAMSGMMSVSGLPDSVPGGGPMKVGISMVDILTSLYAVNAILAALHHRNSNGGSGQYIDLALLDCGLASLSHFAMNYLVSGEVPQRRGNGGYGGVPSQTFACSDRDIFLVAGNNVQFGRLCDAIERPELAKDPRFANTAGRIQNRDALLAILDEVFATRSADDWLARLDVADVPSSAVNDLPQALANPQIQHREMIQTIQRPGNGDIQILRNPIRFSATPIETYTPPPAVGEQTEAVLKGLGYDAKTLEDLRARRVI
jgi:crotonobetainyl-CoA:carnitine CoA-transferase CaiB-like acyl-CoA transferase